MLGGHDVRAGVRKSVLGWHRQGAAGRGTHDTQPCGAHRAVRAKGTDAMATVRWMTGVGYVSLVERSSRQIC